MTLLTQDNDRNVKVTALANPNLPSTVLSQIMPQIQDEDEIERILQGQSRTGKHNSHMPTDVLEKLSQHPDDLPTILTEYVQSENAFVRFITLLHPLTPQNILTQGASSASWLERYAVADNPATSTQTKQQLTQDSNRIVKAAVKANL